MAPSRPRSIRTGAPPAFRAFRALATLVALAAGAPSCSVVTSDWIVVPVTNRQGADVPLALIALDLDRLGLSGDPARIAVYGEGRVPLATRALPPEAPTRIEVRAPLPAAGLRLTLVSPGPARDEDWPLAAVNRWAAEVDYDGTHR